jgi:hypothetical protein
MSSSGKQENQPRSNVLFRFLGKARNEKPDSTSSFLSAGKQYNNFIIHQLTHSDSTYRQNVQKLNDEGHNIRNDIIQQTVVSTLGLYPIVTNHGAL